MRLPELEMIREEEHLFLIHAALGGDADGM